ncbi:MAG: hypothetical protein KDA38_09150 [Planctomycetales bacterium]|nr:hypothetical protein [Planctomycetales bacterium]
MPYLLGTDEAGYGPNFGPLVITATAWRTLDDLPPDRLYQRLSRVVTDSPQLDRHDRRLQLADSKLLYQPRGSLARLERAVFTACGLLGRSTSNWLDVWSSLALDCVDDLQAESWYSAACEPVPLDCQCPDLLATLEAVRDGLAEAGVELIDVQSRVLFPARFNQQVAIHGSKGEVLSRATLELAAEVMGRLRDEPILLICDKHGGRNKYQPLLQSIFADDFVEVRGESRATSVYRWGRSPRRREARFVAKGEGYLPAALASIVSKYLRELAMRAFNRFWRTHLPNIRPTAGYPLDARRFKQEIAATQTQLGIADETLWRCR